MGGEEQAVLGGHWNRMKGLLKLLWGIFVQRASSSPSPVPDIVRQTQWFSGWSVRGVPWRAVRTHLPGLPLLGSCFQNLQRRTRGSALSVTSQMTGLLRAGQSRWMEGLCQFQPKDTGSGDNKISATHSFFWSSVWQDLPESLFVYLWLCPVFVAARGLSPVGVMRDYSSFGCIGAVVNSGWARGIFLDQGSNLCLLH